MSTELFFGYVRFKSSFWSVIGFDTSWTYADWLEGRMAAAIRAKYAAK